MTHEDAWRRGLNGTDPSLSMRRAVEELLNLEVAAAWRTKCLAKSARCHEIGGFSLVKNALSAALPERHSAATIIIRICLQLGTLFEVNLV